MAKKSDKKKSKKSKDIFCDYCKKAIRPKDTYTLLGTYEGEEIKEEVFYHINCWKRFYHQSIQEHAINLNKNITAGITKLMNDDR
jgi:hypothetical protein